LTFAFVIKPFKYKFIDEKIYTPKTHTCTHTDPSNEDLQASH